MGARRSYRSRLCLVTDIESYSTHTLQQHADAQQRLLRVMQFACAHAGILRVSSKARQDRGDGQLLVMPPRLDLPRAVPALINGLRHAMYLTNQEPGPFGRMRIRVALAHGSVAPGSTGFVGRAPITANRLLDSPQLKQALQGRQSADAAFIAPDDVYQDVIKQVVPDLPADEFVRVDVRVKEYVGAAWMYLPDSGPVLNTTSATALWGSVATAVVVAGIAASTTGSGFGLGAPGFAAGHLHGDASESTEAYPDVPDDETDFRAEADVQEHEDNPYDFDHEHEEGSDLDHDGHDYAEVSDGLIGVDDFGDSDTDDDDYSDVIL